MLLTPQWNTPVPTREAEPTTVLVAEDSLTQALHVKLVLEDHGYRAVVVHTGEEALEWLAANEPPDVFISDVIMPGIDGVETLGLLRRVDKEIPVFLMSGLSEEDAMGRFTNGDIAGFVKKPFRAQQLLARIRDVVDAGRAEASAKRE